MVSGFRLGGVLRAHGRDGGQFGCAYIWRSFNNFLASHELS